MIALQEGRADYIGICRYIHRMGHAPPAAELLRHFLTQVTVILRFY